MVRLLVGITWEYIKSALGERLSESWPAVTLGYFLHLFWDEPRVAGGIAEILAFGVHLLEVVTVVTISGLVGLIVKDTYKLLVGPKIIQPAIKKITKLFKNGKETEDSDDERAA